MKEKTNKKKSSALFFLALVVIMSGLLLGVVYFWIKNTLQSFDISKLEQQLTEQEQFPSQVPLVEEVSKENSGAEFFQDGEAEKEEIVRFLVSWRIEIDELKDSIKELEQQIKELSYRISGLETGGADEPLE